MKLMELKIEKQVDLNMVLKKYKFNEKLLYSPLIILLINNFQKKGKKHLIEKYLIIVLKLLKIKSIFLFEKYLEKSINLLLIPVILISKKKGGISYKSPKRINLLISILKSLKLLNIVIKNNYKITFSKSLYLEIKNILKNKGISISTKQKLLKQALLSRVFSNIN
uniref:30S ribosomal protein S7 n=1 Tax=Nephromyces sp. ex Molgula occidentalis TaxID=2544991 RepID=A0A5C1H7J7_9APIC|nr:30S ribosomal protein S7 [Nephromyces sp. ex Molgula occidentalis]